MKSFARPSGAITKPRTEVLEPCYLEGVQNELLSQSILIHVLEPCYLEWVQNGWIFSQKYRAVLELCYLGGVRNSFKEIIVINNVLESCYLEWMKNMNHVF